MREIAYFMLEPRAGEAPSIRLGSRALRWETPRLERFLWHGYRVSLYLFPCRLEGTKRLHWWMERIGSRRCRMQRWRQKFCVVSRFGKIWYCLRM